MEKRNSLVKKPSVLLAAADGRIEEAEVNPLIAGDWGCLAVDGLVKCSG